MSSRRLRFIAICVVLLVLSAGGGVWFASRQSSSPTASNDTSAPSASTTSTTEAPQSPTPSTRAPLTSSEPRVDPGVDASIAATGKAQVLAVFDAQVSGTDDEKRAQVQAGINAITAALPAGSWSVVGDTPTDPVASLVIDASALAVLQQLPGIEHVNNALHEYFPAETATAELPTGELGVSASTSTMGAPAAWAAGFKGAGTTIAIVDTGVQTDHSYLMNGTVQKTVGEACFAEAFGYTSPCPGGVMGINDPSRVGAGAPCPVDIVTNGQQECVHGTHVAGIAAGGTGSGTSGIAPAASLISVQVFSYKYSTSRVTANTFNIDNALQWLYNRRADFPGLTAVNLSLGDGALYTGSCDVDELSTYNKVQQLRNVGIATIVAAGNEYRDNGVSAPACLSNVVAVAALNTDVASDVRADYSNIGPQVKVFAPGTLNSSVPCNGSAVMSGTSMATPAVAGAYAALRQSTVDSTISLLTSTGGAVGGVSWSKPSVKLNAAVAGLPGPPGSVSGSASGSQVAVSWTAASGGSGSISNYTVTARPGGATCSTSGLTCTVTSLDPTKTYVFTVKPTGTTGVGPAASSASVPMPSVPATPSAYVPLNPVRILDTRTVQYGGSSVDGNDVGCGAVGQGLSNVRTLEVLGRGGVPSTGVDAVALNVAVVNPTSANYLTVYPNGSSPPNAANINFVAGQTIPNMAIVKVGTNGKIAIFNNSLSTQVVVDIVGWFPVNASNYNGIVPERMLDTRPPGSGGCAASTVDSQACNTGPIAQGETRLLQIAGRGSIPSAAGVSAVAVNLAAITPTASNFMSVFPGNSTFDGTANINFTAGQIISNMVITKVAPDGTIAIYNNTGATQVTVDVVGYFPATSSFVSFPPQRFVDTRAPGAPAWGGPTCDHAYEGIGPIPPGGSIDVVMTGRCSSVPASGVGAVALNVTVVNSTGSNYLKLSPTGGAQTTVANLNFVAGDTIANMAIVKVGVGGKITIYNNAGSTPVVVDVVGYFPG